MAHDVLSVKTQFLGLTCEARVGLVALLLEHPAAIWQSREEVFAKHLARETKIFQIFKTFNSLSI
jgi:hypothetical protein